MAIRKLIYRALRFHNYPRSPPVRHYSTHSPAFSTPHSTPPSSPSPPPPSFMIYDSLAESVKSKLNRLENPDPRFLRYGSPNPSLADHTSILSSPATRITTLPNGLRVATQSNLAARSASVGVWSESGSRFESEERNGVSNFLKHLGLKGTESGALEEIENVGGHLDGFTSREMTAYYTQVTDRNVAKGIEILGKILQNSDYSEDTINSVRDVVLREREEMRQ